MTGSCLVRAALVALVAPALAMALGCASDGGSGNGSGSGFSDGSESLGASGSYGSESLSTGEEVAELETIYFDFDRAAIRNDQKPTLRANGEAMLEHGEWRTIVIEGHTDERGTEEYNLALGERRANAARQYLADSGVPAARLDTVSFGEAKPSVQGHDESAWRWNRRSEFRVIR